MSRPADHSTEDVVSVFNARDYGASGQARRLMLLLAGVSLVLLVIGLGVGSSGVESLWAVRTDAHAWQIIESIRLPRTGGAWLAGALLGLAGAVAQGLFRNPLADPYLLGSASGASLGVAVAALAFGWSPQSMQWLARLGLTGAAFAGSAGAVMLTLLLARGAQQTLRLLLAGVVVGVVLGALSSMALLLRPELLPVMQSFTLGSTAFVGWAACGVMAAVWVICLLAATLLSRVLDGLALGESTAQSLGLQLPRWRLALVVVLALAAGTAVAQTGLIAFVGLAAPHLVRALLKTTYRWLVVLASLAGGCLLLAADLLARGLVAPEELPVGVLTAVLGGGYLLWLMHRRGVGQASA